MTWRGTTEDGVIVCTNGDRRLEALTTEPNPQNLATLIARVLTALDDAEGDPSRMAVEVCHPLSPQGAPLTRAGWEAPT